MKLIDLLNAVEGSTVIRIAESRASDGAFLGHAEDAAVNVKGEMLFGDVTEIYGETYRAYGRPGISILVKPYESK